MFQAQFAVQVAAAIRGGGGNQQSSQEPHDKSLDGSKSNTPVSSATQSKESTPAPAPQVRTLSMYFKTNVNCQYILRF